MGEKETMDSGAIERTRTGNLVSLDDEKGTVRRDSDERASDSAEKSVQWEPHKAPGLDVPEQERPAKNAMQGNTGTK